MSKEATEVVEITVPVRIRYSTPEGREKAIEWAQKGIRKSAWAGLWSSECGGISAKPVRRKK